MLLRPAFQEIVDLSLIRPRCPSVLWVVAVVAAVVAGGCEASSTVTANPTPVKCQVSLAAPSSVDAGGGTGTLTVTTQPECAWDASTTVSWISGLSPASGQGSAQVEFRVAPNQGASTREGDIVVNGEQVRVLQRAPCRFEVGPANQNIGAGGGPAEVAVVTMSGCSWSATTDANWISLTAPAAGNGDGTVRFTVAANGGSERTGAVIVANQRSTITQAGATQAEPVTDCRYTITPTSQNIGAVGGQGTSVTVTTETGCRWTASSNASWITVTSGSTGSGNGSVTFSVAANTGGSRKGTLTIAGQTFTVTQAAAAPCSYSIAPTTQTVGAGAGAGTVSVTTASGCTWTASSNTSWITIISGASGTGSGIVGFTVEQNDNDKKRTGTLTVAGQTAKVEQQGG